MNKAIEAIFGIFNEFIRRYLAPSMVFFSIFAFIGVTFFNIQNNQEFMNMIDKFKDSKWFLLMFIIGFSYLVQFLHQHLFDDFIKSSYNHSFISRLIFKVLIKIKLYKIFNHFYAKTIEASFYSFRIKIFNNLKDKYQSVIKDNDKEKDYLFYQVLGNKNILGDDTRGYVDSAKLIGFIYFSILLTLVLIKSLEVNSISYICIGIVAVIGYYIARHLIISRYRARNIKIYINYLIKEDIKGNCIKKCNKKSDEKKKECLKNCNTSNSLKDKNLTGTLDINIS